MCVTRLSCHPQGPFGTVVVRLEIVVRDGPISQGAIVRLPIGRGHAKINGAHAPCLGTPHTGPAAQRHGYVVPARVKGRKHLRPFVADQYPGIAGQRRPSVVAQTSQPMIAEMVRGHLVVTEGVASFHYQHFEAGGGQDMSRNSSPCSSTHDDHVIAVADLLVGAHDGRDAAPRGGR